MEKTITEILKGLKALGVKGRARIEYITHDRIKVFVNGEYIGIWDAKRKTFVD